MNRPTVISLILFLMVFLIGPGLIIIDRAEGDQMRYQFPRTISLNLKELPPNENIRIEALIGSQLGILKDLEPFVTTSPDLRCETRPGAIPALVEGIDHRLDLRFSRTGAKPDELGTWVKLGVSYTPDYVRMLKTVANPASFPMEFERQRLIDITEMNQKVKAKFTEATRIFLTGKERRSP